MRCCGCLEPANRFDDSGRRPERRGAEAWTLFDESLAPAERPRPQEKRVDLRQFGPKAAADCLSPVAAIRRRSMSCISGNALCIHGKSMTLRQHRSVAGGSVQSSAIRLLRRCEQILAVMPTTSMSRLAGSGMLAFTTEPEPPPGSLP